jgi:hypothetical protein
MTMATNAERAARLYPGKQVATTPTRSPVPAKTLYGPGASSGGSYRSKSISYYDRAIAKKISKNDGEAVDKLRLEQGRLDDLARRSGMSPEAYGDVLNVVLENERHEKSDEAKQARWKYALARLSEEQGGAEAAQRRVAQADRVANTLKKAEPEFFRRVDESGANTDIRFVKTLAAVADAIDARPKST